MKTTRRGTKIERRQALYLFATLGGKDRMNRQVGFRSLAELLTQRMNEADPDSLPQATAKMADLCEVNWTVTGLYGPKDLGNGPVWALDVHNEQDHLAEVVYCGSRQIINRFVDGLKEAVNDGVVKMEIVWHLRERFDAKGAERSYYTADIRLTDLRQASFDDVMEREALPE